MSEIILLVLCFASVAVGVGIAMAISMKLGDLVRRQDSQVFNCSQEVIEESLIEVLRRGRFGYRYINTCISEDGLLVETHVHPWLWPFILSTPMKIELEPLDDGCRVTVSTCSQRFIRGDVFGFYDRYIRTLLESLTKAIQDTECRMALHIN